jgi:ferredoxin
MPPDRTRRRRLAAREAADSAVVFDIQRFSLHDGPGIRTTVFFKGCPLVCAWCQNPEAIDPKPQMAFNRSHCLDCGQCIVACPLEAIADDPQRRIRFDRCNGCGICAQRCDGRAIIRIGRRWPLSELETELLKARWQSSIHCLPYHRLGEAKLARIDSRLRPLRLDTPLAERLADIGQRFEHEGIHAEIYTF